MKSRAMLLLYIGLWSALLAGCRHSASDEASESVALWALKNGGKITLAGSNVELQRLDQLPKTPFAIERLNLNDTEITNKGLREQNFAGLTRLKYLGLHATRVSDASLDVIAGAKTLTELELSNTQITDAGLPKLAQLKNLKTLFLYNNTLTPGAIDKLKQELPQCTIHH